jgi:two-component system chemotaxis sensor kinase CheA
MPDFDISQFKDMYISEAREYLTSLNNNLLKLEKEPQNLDVLNEIFRIAHTLKGMSATMGFDNVVTLSHRMESLLDKLRKKNLEVDQYIIDLLFKGLDTLEKLIEDISLNSTDKNVPIKEILDEIDSIEVKKTIVSEMTPPPPPTLQIQQEEKKEEIKEEVKKVSTDTIRVKAEHLDRIMNLVGELVINKGMIQQLSSVYKIPELETAVAQFDRTITQLQEEVLITRMVPLKHIFDRYPRAVRDISKRLNKEVELEIIGSEIEVDRTLLDEINEPLVHMLRNAVDHGIEPPQERVALGKSPVGKIRLQAKREKGYCIIEVSDDGRGLDPEEIKRTAIEKKIITLQEAKLLSEQEIFMLICDPNFSTAKEVSDISGRGVGMNVVKNIVEKYNGRLEVISKKHEGTTFVLYLPLTLAIIQSLLVRVGEEEFAIPVANVVEIAKIEEDYLKTIEERGKIFVLRDEILPLVWGEELLNLKKVNKNNGDYGYAIIIEQRERKFGFVVSRLLGQQQIVIKPLGKILKGTKNFSGATILGDGSVVLIIDVGGIYG